MLQVNGVDVVGLGRGEVVQLLREAMEKVELLISRQEVVEEQMNELEVRRIEHIVLPWQRMFVIGKPSIDLSLLQSSCHETLCLAEVQSCCGYGSDDMRTLLGVFLPVGLAVVVMVKLVGSGQPE